MSVIFVADPVGEMVVEVRGFKYVIQQVSSPDLKALRGGIETDIVSEEDKTIAEQQNFFYFVSSILKARKEGGDEFQTQLELRKQGTLS
jgi:hypothetical protein